MTLTRMAEQNLQQTFVQRLITINSDVILNTALVVVDIIWVYEISERFTALCYLIGNAKHVSSKLHLGSNMCCFKNP